MLFKLDIGEPVDLLTKGEVRDALSEDRALRQAITGIDSVEQLFNINQIGAAQQVFSTPVGMVASGQTWAVMNVGAELSAAANLRIYKGIPPGSAAGTGLGRPVGVAASGLVTNATFSKGQFTLKAGDQMTVIGAGAANVLSLFVIAIRCPAERFGELLV